MNTEHEPCDDVKCQECCQHDEHDQGICMDCELDITDILANSAYDAYLERMRDGI